jgi:hypothetical protein
MREIKARGVDVIVLVMMNLPVGRAEELNGESQADGNEHRAPIEAILGQQRDGVQITR